MDPIQSLMMMLGMGGTPTPPMVDPLAMGATPPVVPPLMTQNASLGAALDPVPLPAPRPPEAPGGTYAAQALAPPSPGITSDDITKTLKGVVAPPAPVAQKVSTPNAPALGKIQGGNVAEMLAALGIGPQQAFPGLKLPSTLGQALG